MTPPLRTSILRFWQPARNGRAIAGTGFLATGADGKTYALTCGHVANVVFGRSKDAAEPLTSGTTKADLIDRGEITLDLVGWFAPPPLGVKRATPVADIAIFAPREPFSASYVPPLRVEPPARIVPPGQRQPFHSFGFMATEDGVPAHGALTAVDAGKWFVADGDEGFRRFIEEGLSGAPVYANDAILGMVTQQLGLQVKQGLVIPAFALAQAWPPLAQPYPGLPAFDAPTAHLYFGRGRPVRPDDAPAGRIKQIIDKLQKQRVLALLGASGSGKSSLARAGIAPYYEERMGWATLTFRPGLRTLARAMADSLPVSSEQDRRQAADRWVSLLEKGEFATVFDEARHDAPGILIIVDQFEEFFASGAQEASLERQRKLILPALLEAALDPPNAHCHCLITARLDLTERIVTHDVQAARMLNEPIIVSAMEISEVMDAVTQPAALFDVTVETEFAGRLVDETARSDGRLPLLQVALQQAWSRLSRKLGLWTISAPELSSDEGILDAAIRKQGDAALEALERGRSDRPGVAKKDLRRILLGLVGSNDGVLTRALVRRTPASEADWPIYETLAEHRLVTLSGEGAAELVHESIITAWPWLAELVRENAAFLDWRTRFGREFRVWRGRGESDEDLLRTADLSIALDWLQSDQSGRPSPNEAERAFIIASRDHHDRRTQELERLLAQAQAAEAAAREARDAALLQESRALAAFAQQESARGDHLTAVLLALEGLPSPAFGAGRPLSSAAAAALRQAWLRNRETALPGHTEPVTAAAFSPDGKRVVTASNDGTARVWDLSGPRPAATVLEGHTGPVTAAAFSPDGKRVVTASNDCTARVWDLSGPRPAATVLEGHTGPVTAAAFSPDGKRVVTASEDNTARVWDLSGPRPAATVLEGHTGPVSAAAFSPDGKRVVTASGDGTARVWDLSGPHPIATVLEGHTNLVTAAAFSPDGKRVVTASYDDTVRVWDLSGPHPAVTVLEGHTDKVTAAAFSPDGRTIRTLTADGKVWSWETPDIAELSALVVSRLSRCLSTAQRERFGLAVTGTARPRGFVPPPDADGHCPR